MRKITSTTTVTEAIEILKEEGLYEKMGAVFMGNSHITNKKLVEYAEWKIEQAKEKENPAPQPQTKWMKYAEYKNNFSNFKTVPNSYDKKSKSILVILSDVPVTTPAKTTTKTGICPRCGTYCYGDCYSN